MALEYPRWLAETLEELNFIQELKELPQIYF